LAVLEREQAAHLPTRRQNAVYRAFSYRRLRHGDRRPALEFFKSAMKVEPSYTEPQVPVILFVK
jgi:hypothetical protein